MKKYAFLLGNHPLLAFTEILNLLSVYQIPHRLEERREDILIVSLKADSRKLKELHKLLGGTIKIVEVKASRQGKIFTLDQYLTSNRLLKEYFAQRKRKINFGFSFYGEPPLNYAEINWLKNFAHAIKQSLREEYSIRYVDSPHFSLSSVQVTVNQMISRGAEIVIIRTKDALSIGRTISVQDFREYSRRDWSKPRPDAESGMLPPKLAQMIINITRQRRVTRVFDPFCGSGVLLHEARLLGFKIAGSDLSEKAVKDAQENLRFLSKLAKLPQESWQKVIKKADATRVSWPSINRSETIIVTEPYLGPAHTRILFPHQARPIVKELSALYLEFFKNLKKNFSKIRLIGIIFPALKTIEGLKYLPILDELKQLGYTPKSLLPKEVAKKEAQISARGGFLYSRPDQIVVREFFVFEKAG